MAFNSSYCFLASSVHGIDAVKHGTEFSQRSLYIFLLNRYGDEWQSLRLFVCQARNSCLRSPWDLFNSSSCCIPFPTASRRHYCSLFSAQPSIGKGARSAWFIFSQLRGDEGGTVYILGGSLVWVMRWPYCHLWKGTKNVAILSCRHSGKQHPEFNHYTVQQEEIKCLIHLEK